MTEEAAGVVCMGRIMEPLLVVGVGVTEDYGANVVRFIFFEYGLKFRK